MANSRKEWHGEKLLKMILENKNVFQKLPKNDDRVEKCRLVAKTWPHPPWCSSSSFHQDRDDKQLHRIGYFLFRSFKDKLSSKSHIHNHLHHHHMRPTTRSHLSSLDHQRAPFRARAAGNTASIHVRPGGHFRFYFKHTFTFQLSRFNSYLNKPKSQVTNTAWICKSFLRV